MKPLFLVYTHHPMCSLDCSDAICEVLNQSGLYEAKMVGPDSHPKLDLTDENLKNVDCLVIPGGWGDSDQFDAKLKHKTEIIVNYVRNGGKYFGICMGSYFAGHHYLNILNGYEAHQYIKRKGCSTNRENHDIVTLNWNKIQKTVYFHDGAAFIPTNKSSKAKIIARYQNGDAAALIQKYKKGRVGVIGPHPEAHKWWFYSQTRIKKRWKDCVHHELILDFVERLLK